ncbi:MAG: hypothetical protein U1E05_18720, partial [Patescibacteria group bacterium]|nr:hypothetical protein [Patescibacteria group bacterium]
DIACDPVGASLKLVEDASAQYNCTPCEAKKKYSHTSEVSVQLGLGPDDIQLTIGTSHTEGQEEEIVLPSCTAVFYRYEFTCKCTRGPHRWVFLFPFERYPGTLECTMTAEGWQNAEVSDYCPDCTQ